MSPPRLLLSIVLFFTIIALPARASDYNIRLLTDSAPDLTDIASYVNSITAKFDDPQQKAIAIWSWDRSCRRQTSCAQDRGRLIWDPVLHFNSYGFMNCGIISALNVTVAINAGFEGRYIQLGDHTVCEFSWDKGSTWHMFDSSMSFFCYNHKGIVAGCEEIKGSASCELSGGKSEPGHFYFYHGAPQCVSNTGPVGWRCASDNPVEYQRTLKNGASSFTSGYDVSRYSRMAQWGRRYILNLKPYQSYTRYWKMIGTDPGFYRAARGEKKMSDLKANRISRTVRANGLWKFQPDLSSSTWRDFVYDHDNLEVSDVKPYFRSKEQGRVGRAVFKIDAANVITSMKIKASVRCSDPGSEVCLFVSNDAGLAWKKVCAVRGPGEKTVTHNLIEQVAGHTEALVKFEFKAAEKDSACGLDSLSIKTITQVNRLALPRLSRGRNRVQLRLGEQTESLVLWPVLHGGAYKNTIAEESNIYTTKATDCFYRATIGAGANNTPCFLLWRLPAPSDISRLTVGARVCNRGGGYVSLKTSWDGKNYKEIFRKSDGSSPFDLMVLKNLEPVPGINCCWIKCEFFTKNAANTYNTTGIQDIFMRLSHKPAVSGFSPIEVTYCWTEHQRKGDVTRRYTKVVTSPAAEWRIDVGGFRDPTMNWIRLKLFDNKNSGAGDNPGGIAGENPGGKPGQNSGQKKPVKAQPLLKPSDGSRRKVIYHWGKNLARNASYKSDRSACSSNGDKDGRELTNGIIIPPTTYFSSHWPEGLQEATAGWDGEVSFDVDLGKTVTVAGARVCTHQPDNHYCHPARVVISVSIDGNSWHRAGSVSHDDLWNPPGDYEPWEGDCDPKYDSLPAAGRLAYGFPCTWAPLRARYVRFHFIPLRGKGIGISELQVFDSVDVVPFKGGIELPAL